MHACEEINSALFAMFRKAAQLYRSQGDAGLSIKW